MKKIQFIIKPYKIFEHSLGFKFFINKNLYELNQIFHIKSNKNLFTTRFSKLLNIQMYEVLSKIKYSNRWFMVALVDRSNFVKKKLAYKRLFISLYKYKNKLFK